MAFRAALLLLANLLLVSTSVLSNNEEEYLLEKDATYPKTPVPAPAPPKAPVKPITPPPVVKPPTTYPPLVKPPTTTPPVVKLPTVAPAPPVKPPTVMPTPPLKPPPTYPPPVKPPTTTPPPVSPPKTAPAPQVPSPASSPMPIVRSNKDCIPLCAARCKAHSRPNIFGRACTTCCVRCKCVPPGTYGNRENCGKCYTDMTTRGNKPNSPVTLPTVAPDLSPPPPQFTPHNNPFKIRPPPLPRSRWSCRDQPSSLCGSWISIRGIPPRVGSTTASMGLRMA
ncbi:hypothetical protein WN944_006822 [Citrus x changshan-huyou]|uniref:Gibberellin-regulated protein 14 n=1 Tax=Citrus x changshan-huyou TaxID=2935761 RepID=A0AAP0MMD2_9ROSI